MEEPYALDLVVHGRVQGVWFRDSTRQQAELRGVVGWVRNEPDSTVRAHLEGDRAAVEEVLTWIRAGGPPRATVTDVQVTTGEPDGTTGFQIR